MFYAVLIYIMAVISPGPNFILVSRFSAFGTIGTGLSVTLGICTVGACFSTLSLLGLSSIIHVFPPFVQISVLLGSLYLLYIAWKILLGTTGRRKVVSEEENSDIAPLAGRGAAFRAGALTNIFNMKTIAFMIGIYSGFLAVPRTAFEQFLVVLMCSSLEFLWYAFVVVVFSRPAIKTLFYRYGKGIDRGLAIFLILFAMQNIYSLY